MCGRRDRWVQGREELYRGSALRPFLSTVAMDRLTDKVRQESLWTMMFADDTVICNDSKEQVEERLERWRQVCTRQKRNERQEKQDRILARE